MCKKFISILLGGVILFPIASYAEDSYLKIGVGGSTYSGFPNQTPTAGYIAYGRTIAPNLSGEIGYIDFGTSGAKLSNPDDGSVSTFQFRTRSIYLAGISDVPITSSVSFQGKLGMVMHRSNENFNFKLDGFSFREDSTYRKTQALVGAGLKAQFSKEISGVVEYTYFGKAVDGMALSLLSAGLLYHF
jgi:hypothetical protein